MRKKHTIKTGVITGAMLFGVGMIEALSEVIVVVMIFGTSTIAALSKLLNQL